MALETAARMLLGTCSRAYGLSNQTFQKWLTDSFKELAVGLVFGGLLLWVPYLLIRLSPRRWWLYTALLSLPVMFFVMLVEPIWVAPLFSHFGPMKDKHLEAQILALAQEAGIEGGRVFEVDKSVDTNAVNAYVTGFLGTKRIEFANDYRPWRRGKPLRYGGRFTVPTPSSG